MTTSTIIKSDKSVDIDQVQLSEKFKKASYNFHAAWNNWLDDATSWVIYLNEMIEILHDEHPDWSIATISRVIRKENAGLRGFSKSTIYRHLNMDNKSLLDKAQQEKRIGKNKIEDERVSSPLEEFRKEKGKTVTVEQEESEKRFPNGNQNVSETAVPSEEEPEIIYDDPVKQLEELQEKYKDLLLENQRLIEENIQLRKELEKWKRNASE